MAKKPRASTRRGQQRTGGTRAASRGARRSGAERTSPPATAPATRCDLCGEATSGGPRHASAAECFVALRQALDAAREEVTLARAASATCSRPCPRRKKSWVALLVEISRSPAAWALPAGWAVDPLQEERGRGAFHAGKPLRAEEGGAEVPPQGGFDQERADVDQDDMQRGPVTINVWPQQLLGRELIDLCPRQDEQPLQQRAARCIALEQRAADIREDGRVPPDELRDARAELARVLPR